MQQEQVIQIHQQTLPASFRSGSEFLGSVTNSGLVSAFSLKLPDSIKVPFSLILIGSKAGFCWASWIKSLSGPDWHSVLIKHRLSKDLWTETITPSPTRITDGLGLNGSGLFQTAQDWLQTAKNWSPAGPFLNWFQLVQDCKELSTSFFTIRFYWQLIYNFHFGSEMVSGWNLWVSLGLV